MSPPKHRFGPRDIKTLGAIIATVTVTGITYGLTLPLLSIIIERRGYDGWVNGLFAAMPAIALVIFTPFIPRILGKVPVIGFLITCLAAIGLSLVALRLYDNLAFWFAVRFLMGAAAAGTFTVSETWINEIAPDAIRGRVMGIYSALLSLGFAVGIIALRFTGTEGWPPFLAGIVMLAIASAPLYFAAGHLPKIGGRPSMNLIQYILIAPAAAATGLIFGALEIGAFALLPPYGMRLGLAEAAAAQLLAIVAIGEIFLQVPIGWMADRVDRRLLLLTSASVGMIGALILPFAFATPIILYPTLFLWGGFVVGLYAVGLTLIGERFRGPDLAGANAAYITLYGIGALIGPPAMGWSMDYWYPHGLAGSIAVTCLILIIVVGARILYRRSTNRKTGS